MIIEINSAAEAVMVAGGMRVYLQNREDGRSYDLGHPAVVAIGAIAAVGGFGAILWACMTNDRLQIAVLTAASCAVMGHKLYTFLKKGAVASLTGNERLKAQ